MLERFFKALLRVLLGGGSQLQRRPEPPPVTISPPGRETRQPGTAAPPGPPLARTIVPLLIYPRLTGNEAFNQLIEVGNDKYYTSHPWEVDETTVNEAIRSAEDWLADALGRRIGWNQLRVVNSERTLTEWRDGKIYLIKDEVERLGLDWNDDYIYLAFVRGMGGYAGGILYQNGNAGFGMVGDVCLEAICDYPLPTAGSILLESPPWSANSYSKVGQTGAFIHEALHGLDLPHPDSWPAGEQPDWNETLMGYWWNMPIFTNTGGLTQREAAKVLRWTA